MNDTQEINLLFEFDLKSPELLTCKIISNIKDLILSKSVSLIKNTVGDDKLVDTCKFCTNSFEIFLYQMNNDNSTLEQKLKNPPESPLLSEPVIIKEEPIPIELKITKPVKEQTIKKKTKERRLKQVRKTNVKEVDKTEDGFFKCDVCKTEFHSRRSLASHRAFCNGNYLGRYNSGPNPHCSYCAKSYSTWNLARIHEKRVHTRNLIYTCEVCGYSTTTKSSFEIHKIRDHKNFKKLFSCDLCGYRCGDKNAIRKHINTKHLKIIKNVCGICGKDQQSSTALQLHIMHKHSNERNYPCDKCNKSFKTSHSLKEHNYKIHVPSNQKPKLSCEACDYVTHCKFSLLNHQALHLDPSDCPFRCETCNRGFMTKHTLKSHQRTHSNNRPFSCGACSKTFKTKADLTIHTRYHTGEKPYECEICGQRYSDRGCYRSHLIVHEKQLGITLDKSIKKFLNKSKIV